MYQIMKNFKNFLGKCRKNRIDSIFAGFVLALLLFALLMNVAAGVGEKNRENLNNTLNAINANYTVLKYDYETARSNYFESLSYYNEAKAGWLVSRQKYLENKNDENYKIFINSTKKFILNLSVVLENYNEMLKKRVLSDDSFDDITKNEQISQIDILLDKIKDIKKQLSETPKSQLTIEALKNFAMELQETYAHSQHIRGMVVTTILKNKMKIVIAGLVEDSLKMYEDVAQLKASGYNTTEMEEKLCKLNEMLNQSYANYQKCVNLMNLSTSKSLAEAENLFKTTYKSAYKIRTDLNDIYSSIPGGWISELESANSTYVAKGDGKAVINIDKADIKIYVVGSVTLKGDTDNAKISLKNLKEMNSSEGKVYGGDGNIEITGKDLIIEISGKDINIAIAGNGNATLTGTGTQKACDKGLCISFPWEGKNIKFSK